MGSAAGDASSGAAVAPVPNDASGGAPRAASSTLATSATSPAGITYLSRARTVPGMSVCCEPALAMLVSETGEIESPKVAPARIAPISTAGDAPSPPPAG